MNKKSLIALSVSAAFAAGVFMSNYAGDVSQSIIKDVKPALKQTVADIPALEKMMLQHHARLQPSIKPTVTGNYLSGRSAQKHKDWDNAYKYMSDALELSDLKSANKNGVLDRAFLMAITTGDMQTALNLGDDIIALRENAELTHILKAVHHFKSGDYDKADFILSEIDTEQFGGYAVPLLQAWNAIAMDDKVAALQYLKSSEFSNENAYALQTALILDYAEDYKGADAAYRTALQSGLDLEETLLAANFFERSGDWSTAGKIYSLFDQQEPNNPYLKTALKRVAAQEAPAASFDTVNQGMAYTLYKMAHLLNDRDATDSALIYNRIAEYVGHSNADADILMGDLMAKNGHYDEAFEYYNHITPNDILYKTAQMRKVTTLEDTGRNDEALGILAKLQTNDSYTFEALVRAGDIHQSENQFGMAVDSYNQALNQLGDNVKPEHWGLYFARGVAHEKLNNWQAAERDFIQALDYSPNNPAILNVLGYTWVDNGINLERAMDMIERAVNMRPHDGYIMDSYGWAFYKLGEYEQAAYWLERAIEIHPEDATMNDHLGDAYWQSGRIKEARYQWERANRFSDDATLQTALADKLKNGLIEDKATDSAAVIDTTPDAL